MRQVQSFSRREQHLGRERRQVLGPRGTFQATDIELTVTLHVRGNGSAQEPKGFLGNGRQEEEMYQLEPWRTKLVLRIRLGQWTSQ